MLEINQPIFFTIPYRIIQLPGLTLSYLKIYESIFEIVHSDNANK